MPKFCAKFSIVFQPAGCRLDDATPAREDAAGFPIFEVRGEELGLEGTERVPVREIRAQSLVSRAEGCKQKQLVLQCCAASFQGSKPITYFQVTRHDDTYWA
jgi:hypothetical protein